MAQRKKQPNAKGTKLVKETADSTVSVRQKVVTKLRQHKKKILLLLVVVLFGVLVWKYLDARRELRRYRDPKVAVEEETKSTENEVAKVMILPQGEQPTVANISDVGKLKDKPFFANAHNGDVVLIYQQAKRAIIYRPSTKQIVEVATYNAGDDPVAQPGQ